MKKFLSILLIAVLVSAMLVVPASADNNDEPAETPTNVALNKEYTISGNGKNYSHTGSVTDGIVCEKPFSGSSAASKEERLSSWFCFYYHVNAAYQPNVNAPDGIGYLIIDLEDEYDLSALKVFLIDKPTWGSPIPDAVNAYVSLDGVAFEEVGTFDLECEEDSPFWSEIEVDCKARYLKIEMDLGSTEGYLGEVEAYGVKAKADNGGNDGDNGGDKEEDTVDVEALMKEALGAAPADSKVEYVIEAPEAYEAGDEITVKVIVKNITAENGIHVVSFILNYDNEKLLLTNDLDEEDENALVCVTKLPKDWENLSVVANDYSDENPEGTVVNPLNDGVIEVNVFTAKSAASAAIKEDGALELEFTFKVLDNAAGDIGLVIPNATAEGAYNGKGGEIVYEATGSYAVIKAPVVDPDEPGTSDEPSTPDEPVVPGDASNMIIFAIIALVAIAGSAVVIKTRK